MTTTAYVPTLGAPRPTGTATRLRFVVSDTLTLTKRNILNHIRIPESFFFATVQPIMFVLLFRYVFGGAIKTPEANYVNYLMPGIFVQTVAFGSTSTGIGLAEDLQKGLIERFRALPMARSAVLAGRTTADLCRNVFVVIVMTAVGLRGGIPSDDRRCLVRRRVPSHPRLRVRALLGHGGDRAVGAQQRDGPGDVVPTVVPAHLRVVRVRPGLVDAELAAGLRHLPAGERDGDRLPRVDDRRSDRQLGHPVGAVGDRDHRGHDAARRPSVPHQDLTRRVGSARLGRARLGSDWPGWVPFGGSAGKGRMGAMADTPTDEAHQDTFGARSRLSVGDATYEIHRIDALADRHDVARLPYSIKVILENLLRHEDGLAVKPADVEAAAGWGDHPERHGFGEDAAEIAFTPERVLMQDFTGVPGVVDLAAMRDALGALGGDPARVNPLVPVELVIDHSVIAEESGTPTAFDTNVDIEYQRNIERYQLLGWAQQAFDAFRVVPPGTGICHQVNLEYLSRVVFATDDGRAYCDTLVGTDSHTTMVNGLGVLGWGVGGIEAEAAMLGQPLSMLLPPVVGFRSDRRPADRHHRDRSGPHHHQRAPPPRRRREVRRVLRPRAHLGAVGHPGDHRQHVARVRGDLCDLPRRRGHARLPPFHRARRPPRRPGRGLHEGTGHVPRAGVTQNRSSRR